MKGFHRVGVVVALVAMLASPVAGARAAQPSVGQPPSSPDAGPSLSQLVPPPSFEHRSSRGELVAIAVGAVAGAIAANVVTGGLLTPVLVAGAGAGGVAAGISAGSQMVLALIGAAGGGYLADRLYLHKHPQMQTP